MRPREITKKEGRMPSFGRKDRQYIRLFVDLRAILGDDHGQLRAGRLAAGQQITAGGAASRQNIKKD